MHTGLSTQVMSSLVSGLVYVTVLPSSWSRPCQWGVSVGSLGVLVVSCGMLDESVLL